MANITLLHGDCLALLDTIPDNTVDLIVTDPPYNLGNFMISRDTNLKKMRDNFFAEAGWDNLSYGEWVHSMDIFFEQMARISKRGASIIVFMAAIKVETVISLAEKHGFYYKTTGIWHKSNPMPRNMNLQFINSNESWLYFVYRDRTGTFNNNGCALHDFIETSVTPLNERKYGKHPTQKPEKLFTYFVKTLSNEGDVVIDPFMGSGTCAVVAKKLNRQFIGIELDERYFKIAEQRVREI